MKRIITLCLAAATLLLCGCGGTGGGKKKPAGSGVDYSVFPERFEDWSAGDFLDYFRETVEFPADCEYWLQDHENYWAGLPVYESCGVWNVSGANDVCLMVFVLDPKCPDTTPEAVKSLREAVLSDPGHNYDKDDLFLGKQDHMAGNFMFSYGSATADAEVRADIEAAYTDLLTHYGAEGEF